MYFDGNLAVDPSQKTEIIKVKPTKAFAKVFSFLSAGLSDKKEEQETFTAISILQQINSVLRSMGINNIVRLMKDDLDVYLDSEGKEDDLKEAIEAFLLEFDAVESELFNSLVLVAEHEDNSFKYLIEIKVARIHKVGEYPISINVTGVLKQFKSDNDDVDLNSPFSNQDSYDAFMKEKKAAFKDFLSNLEQGVRKFILSDNIKNSLKVKIMRPSSKVSSRSGIKSLGGRHTGMHYGYYGWNDYMLYCYLWGDMCHSNNIYVNNATIIDDKGADVMDIGEQGFDAGASNTLNSEADIEPPADADVSYHSENEFSSDLPLAEAMSESESSMTDDSSFFDDLSSDDSSTDSSDCSSCSSCSSCGSCGGD